ncbi:MAX dimerization protein MGA a isoform X2 [Brienomyrus brachyistius]|nr:MAX dimerization protein MGA a isoform X2 [Brienomyrus brachyistius]XP_048830324.1 MAX dimerization protein MGA a isoform X2 [Brienomyrus brachyistius]XP_048830325.1 MAX dimerization protein MGA a isoform X2 [Brienomyrus brachyistius]
MAATESQALMVLKEEGAATPVTTPTSAATPLAFFVILKPGHTSEGGQDQGILVTNQEANMATTSTQATPAAGQSACAPSLQSDICSTMADPHPENLPPETVCKGVRVTLDNNNMWNEFYRCRTEMILTKQGRRMFPYCRFRISGMEPFQRYILVMDITPMDNHRYKWNGWQWETNGKAEPHVLGRVFIHPDSPSSGHYWMQNPVSFYKLKLTNNTLDQEGHVILHSMHRYLPRLHVVPADKATEVIRLNGPNVLTFTFPQNEFFAVTAYQNLRITQLKIDYNPFAKGFRDDGSCSRPKPDSSEMGLELCRPPFGSEEQQTIKVNQQHLDNSDAYDSFVMDKELFPSADFGTETLDNGISPPKTAFADKDRSRRKRARVTASAEAMQAVRPKLRRSVPEKKDKNGTSESTESAEIVVKEEEEEVEVFSDDAVPRKSKLDSSAEQTGVQVEGSGNCGPVVAEKVSVQSTGTSTPDSALSLGSTKGAPETGTSGRSFQKSVLPANTHDIIPLPQLAQFLKERNLIVRSKPKNMDISPSTVTPTPLPRVSPPLPPDSEPMPNVANPSAPVPGSSEEPGDSQENLETPFIPSTSEPSVGVQAESQSSLVKKKRKFGARYRRHGKFVRRPEVEGGPTDVNMQPNLEDVEGLLFVSFTSKEALNIHLGDQSVSREAPPHPPKGQESPADYGSETTQEKIIHLEQELLHDLKRMKHRQVIHPVLQEVGLKLNLLDQTLPIDLQYLGVCLPLPPPFCPPEDGVSALPTSSPDGLFPFVSRTGKTTDYTKIKGWRDKFNITPEVSSSKPEGVGGLDAALKNRSAFCSDMLDEYLANEGKLIDERAANFSQSAESPVVYQLPTKSTSYVRTLDSVLKKQIPRPVASRFPFKSVTAPKKPRMSQRARTPARHKYSSSESKSKATAVSGSQTSTITSPNNVNQAISTSSRTKSMKTKVGKIARSSVGKPAPDAVRLTTPPTAQSKATPGALPDKVNVLQDSNLVNQGSPGLNGRSPGLSKMLLKLMDLEDGAVWEGKERTCVTEDRAAIALAALLTAQGTLKGSKAANRVIKRRAPPCLIDFCRLGCVCSSLAQEHRRFTHCGKPECMFGCTCLKRRVVLVKAPPSPTKNTQDQGDLIFYDALEEEARSKPKKKKKKRMAYTISEPEQESEPAARVQTLWNPKVVEIDPEPLYAPTPVSFPWSQVVIRQESPSNLVSKEVPEEEKDPVYRYFESMMTCARVRPFSKAQAQTAAVLWKFKEDDAKNTILIRKPGKNQKKPGETQQTTSQSEPVKRLEIVSECPWEKKTDRNHVLRIICEYMAQNRLSHSFHVGPYLVKPVSQSSLGQDSTVTYKVCISQLKDGGGEVQDEDWYTELSSKTKSKEKCKEEGEEWTSASRSRVLPFLTRVSPAGLLIANKKQPGVSTQGHIKVNGKSYPQAKLQLGQMGALHPANRLAAYITGRLRPIDHQPSGTALGAAKSPNHLPLGGSMDGDYTLQLPRMPVNSLCSSTTTSSTTTTTTSVMGSGSSPTVAAVLKNLVAKPTVGKVVTQFVVNKFNSLQQRLPIVSAPQVAGSLQKVALPSGHLLVVGPSLPSRSPQTEQGVQGATAASTVISPSKLPQGGSSVQEPASPNSSNVHPTLGFSAAAGSFGTAGVINVPPITLLSVPPGLQREETSPSKGTVAKSPGSAVPSPPRMLLIPVSQAVPAVRPATASPITPGQKMILQPVRGTTGTNLYRHPNGQLVQLVPLSQLRAIQPNLVIRSPGGVVRLPTPSVTVSNPAISPTSAIKTPLTTAVTKVITDTSPTPVVNQSPTSSILTSTVTIQATSPTTLPESPACSSDGVTKTTPSTLATSPASAPKLSSLSGATAFTLSTLTPSLKTIPGFLGQTGTYTVRIAPGTKESKVITLNTTGPLPNSPEVLSGQSGFTLLQIPKPAVTVKPTLSQVVITPMKPDVVTNIPAKNDTINSPSSNDQAPEVHGDKDPSQDAPVAPARADHSYTSGQDSSKESKASADDGSFTAGSTQEKSSSVSSAESPTIKPCEIIPSSVPSTMVGQQPPSLMVPVINISEVISAVSAAEKRSKESASESPSGAVVPGPMDTGFDVLAVEREAIPKASQEKRLLEEGEVEVEADMEVTGESEELTDDSEEESEDESVSLAMDPEDSEEDESVDIETVEELTEKINIARMKAAAMQMKLDKVLMFENKTVTESNESPQKRREETMVEEQANVAGRIQHNVTERRRRTELRGLFEKLRHILGLQHMPKASKYFILKQANGEIQALVDQNDHLEERKRLLNRQRATYIKKISQTSGKTEELIIKKLQDICAKQKSLEAQRRKKAGVPVDPKPSKPKVSPPANLENLSRPYSSSRRPNILSRRKLPVSQVLPTALVSANDGSLVSGLNAVVSNQQILTVKSPLEPITTLLQPNKVTASGVVLSPVPGVASVTINVPGVSLPIQVKSPLPDASVSLSSQPTSKKNNSEVAAPKNLTITKIISIKSVLPSPQKSEQSDQNSSKSTQHLGSCPGSGPESGGDLEGATQGKWGLEDGEVIGDQLSCDRPRVPKEEPTVNGIGTIKQEEEDDDDTDDDPEDEKLTSLLNEIAFLNQQTNSEDSEGTQSQTQKVRHVLQRGETVKPEPVDHGKGHEGDDERSLSPLFLQLDEDLLGSMEDQSEEKLPRAGADDLVKVSFGSRNHPEHKRDATMANGLRQKSPPSSVKGGALTPPPLLQMKAGNAAVSADSKSKGGENESEVSWRPMPRLAPLGRKTSNPNQDMDTGVRTPPDPLSHHKDNTLNTT